MVIRHSIKELLAKNSVTRHAYCLLQMIILKICIILYQGKRLAR